MDAVPNAQPPESETVATESSKPRRRAVLTVAVILTVLAVGVVAVLMAGRHDGASATTTTTPTTLAPWQNCAITVLSFATNLADSNLQDVNPIINHYGTQSRAFLTISMVAEVGINKRMQSGTEAAVTAMAETAKAQCQDPAVIAAVII